MTNDATIQEKIKLIDFIETIYYQMQQKGEDWLITVNVEHFINYLRFIKENPLIENESCDDYEDDGFFLNIINQIKENYFHNVLKCLEGHQVLRITLYDFLYDLVNAILISAKHPPDIRDEKTRNQIYSLDIDNIDIQDFKERQYGEVVSRKDRVSSRVIDMFLEYILAPYKQDSIH